MLTLALLTVAIVGASGMVGNVAALARWVNERGAVRIETDAAACRGGYCAHRRDA